MFPDIPVVKTWSAEVTELISDGIQKLVACQPQKHSHVPDEDFQDDDP